MTILSAANLTKIYRGARGAVATRALDDFHLTVSAGEFVGVMGPSGSGKSTLLHLLGTIDRPTAGSIHIGGTATEHLKGDALAAFRRKQLGFIFQSFNLVDALTVKENILLPLVLEKHPLAEMEQRLARLAERLGLTDVLTKYPYELSGGQQQRAAAARALIHRPALILADEPTGNLDSRSAKALMTSLSELNHAEKATIIMVTHDPVTASYCSRVLFIKDGKLFTELRAGANRSAFFHQVLDVLSSMGGEAYDALYDRG